MAVKVKHSGVVDDWARSAVFSTATSDFAQDDILDFVGSLGRPAKSMIITCAAGASITFTRNDRVIRYPMNPYTDTLQGQPDLQDPREFRDTNAATETVAASTTTTFSPPLKEIRVTALTVGSGVTIKIY